jgi:ankyrin repeat protein
VFKPCDEELLLRITTCLAQNGYHKEVGVMTKLNKAFWTDEQIWDAYKDVPGRQGDTRLMFASARGKLARVKWLLARGAMPGNTRYDGGCALVAACLGGHLRVVLELCERGANVNASSPINGHTALMTASKVGHLEIFL